MAKIYKQNMLAILTKLNIAKPDHITMDQMQLEDLIAKVKTSLDTYDPLPTGNAAVTDVLLGKTFSNATGTGRVGTLTLAMQTADANAVAAEIIKDKTAYVNGIKLVGTNEDNTKLSTQVLDMATPTITAPITTLMLNGSVHTLLFLTHAAVLVPFAIAAKKADSSEIYLVGSSCTALGVHTVYKMVLTIADGVGTISSIKTDADVEDIANWAADPGNVYCYE